MFLQSPHIAKCVVNRYLCGMALSDNIKAIREEKGLKQIDVASHINVDKSAYSKIEKGSRNVTVEELQGMATLFGMTMDQVVNYETIFSIIDKMLTNKKFKDFFNKNVAAL
jgi:transcriptional regulator with XRE-family HTH domain